MLRFSLVSTAVGALLLMNAPASAGGNYNWSGLYVGAQAGVASSDVEWVNTNTNYFAFEGQGFDHEPKGGLYGGQIGINHQIGSIVIGAEGTFSGINSDDELSQPQYYLKIQTDVDWLATVVGRIGYASDRALFYVRGGYAAANVGITELYFPPAPALGDTFKKDKTQSGWVVGLGIEYALRDNVTLGLEYNHLDFGTETYAGTDTLNVPTSLESDFKMDTVALRLSYKFGGREERVPLK